ncbi:nitroreductase family protein [Spirochaeta lutea]|uniref:Nitroreductase n=1 Tax=Spirochaeta lutea TaxID=1480694 RepID=A0A098QYB8_9SPIO|nr:nitroreductase family protein [Spirochaeta lutea]KGE72845.1 nitroreductase [Spirochaeta lutea]
MPNQPDVLTQLNDRKSVRVFQDRPIAPQERRQIITAALQAPTAGNQMLYTILDIQSQEKKQRLARLCDNQPFIAQAPLVLIFLADCRRWTDIYRAAGLEPRKPQYSDLILALADALIAAQNTVVAAHALNLGSCYIGDIVEQHQEVTSLLTLDPWVVPAAMLVYGYPTEQQIQRRKPPRFDPRYIVQTDSYSPLSETQIRQMFQERSGRDDFDFDHYIQGVYQRKHISEFALEMARSVEIYLKAFA